MFSLPPDFATSTLHYVGELSWAIKVPIFIVVGVSLFIWIVNFLINLVVGLIDKIVHPP